MEQFVDHYQGPKGFRLTRDAVKERAKAYREHWAVRGHMIQFPHCLEAAATQFGFRDWNHACSVLPGSKSMDFAASRRGQERREARLLVRGLREYA